MTLHSCCTFNITRCRCIKYQKAKKGSSFRLHYFTSPVALSKKLLSLCKNGCYKEQRSSNFLENSGNFEHLLRKFGANCGCGYPPPPPPWAVITCRIIVWFSLKFPLLTTVHVHTSLKFISFHGK